ncbi:hypothetical protein BC938DRAFT_472247 [Jimgerdemannia flammicorona]|uniref:Uncharacterized protein n=1 Tax=Jimgerdemannia flammicorona TaxID=994334 RepID=A0A433QU13_9FUNG|nr:hypothetical protein BC938DRAFT_472247 [Jimgerdemannia flammicorona]
MLSLVVVLVISVWDLPPISTFLLPSSYPTNPATTPATTSATPHTVWRGTIDISYLSAAGDAWLTGVWELAVSDTLVTCTSDSLLTGTLVYELNGAGIHDVTCFITHEAGARSKLVT